MSCCFCYDGEACVKNQVCKRKVCTCCCKPMVFMGEARVRKKMSVDYSGSSFEGKVWPKKKEKTETSKNTTVSLVLIQGQCLRKCGNVHRILQVTQVPYLKCNSTSHKIQTSSYHIPQVLIQNISLFNQTLKILILQWKKKQAINSIYIDNEQHINHHEQHIYW